MADSKLKLTIAHLYPDLLNGCGDYGNMIALKQRLQWRDIGVDIVEIKKGDKVNPSRFDFYFIGSGQEHQQIITAKELNNNASALKKACDENIPFLAIGAGFQLLGEYYQPFGSEKINGIGIFDMHTIAGQKRFSGNVTANVDFLKKKTIVGFENHTGLTYLHDGVEPFAKVKVGMGNNGKDKTEGARYKNAYGTYLHGPLLPKNKFFCDHLIVAALERKYKCDIPLLFIMDDIENYAHKDRLKAKY